MCGRRSLLADGLPVIVCVRTQLNPQRNEHYVLITGISRTGVLTVCDCHSHLSADSQVQGGGLLLVCLFRALLTRVLERAGGLAAGRRHLHGGMGAV